MPEIQKIRKIIHKRMEEKLRQEFCPLRIRHQLIWTDTYIIESSFYYLTETKHGIEREIQETK